MTVFEPSSALSKNLVLRCIRPYGKPNYVPEPVSVSMQGHESSPYVGRGEAHVLSEEL
ncbi:hypothetical protein Dimus_024797, partial [Dionaea muscipula]